MKKLVLVSRKQYGYNTDTTKFCEYLSNEYKITFICYDMDLPKVENKNIDVEYIGKYKPGFVSKLRLALKSRKRIRQLQPDYIIVRYFAGCSILYALLKHRRIIVDIRTGFISEKKVKRYLRNKLLSFESNLYGNITVVSEGLINTLKLKNRKTTVLPLGADVLISKNRTDFNNVMHLLYVGTLDYRDIDETISGFGLFYEKYGQAVDCKYTIIGFGFQEEEEKIRNQIDKLNLNGIVSFLGRKKYEELPYYLETHNVGISYIPITEYFMHQPPTKTYEYICNGLICLATDTYENRKIINSGNGVLINEGADEVFKGLEEIYKNINNYDSDFIMDSSRKYSWENIVENILKPYLNSL